ncbi:flagellar protein FlgN, partial [Yersinia enterocolitica]|nr:flagellar protein FlgN [Yersinia enterocolitica]
MESVNTVPPQNSKQEHVKQLLVAIQEDRKRYIALEKLLVKQRELMIKHDSEALQTLN